MSNAVRYAALPAVRGLLLVFLAASTVVVAALAWPVNARPASGKLCASANVLRDNGEVLQAAAAYIAILRRDPSSSCAERGLAGSVAGAKPSAMQCALGDVAFDGGDLDRARAFYEKALANSETAPECATSGLSEVRAVERLCAQGQADLRLDRTDDAMTAFKSALEKNPNATCAEDGVDAAADADRPHWIERGIEWIVHTLLPNLLIVAGLVLGLLFVVALFGYIPVVYGWFMRVPGLGSLLGPRMSVEPFDSGATGFDKLGPALTGRIVDRLQRFREEVFRGGTPDHELDFGTGDDRLADIVTGDGVLRNALDKASGLPGQGGIVGGFLSLLYALLPIRRLSASGVLEPKSTQAAATLRLERNNRLEAATRVVGPPRSATLVEDDYLGLAGPAAIWVQYEVARVLSGDRLLGPDVAESNMRLREGLESQRAGDAATAEVMYRRASVLDGDNWAAKVNLAMLEARRTARDYDASVQILRDTLDDMKRQLPVLT